MSYLLKTAVNRTRNYSGTGYEDDATTELALAAQDVLHIKIGTAGDSPLIDFSSADPSSGASTCSFTAGSGDYTFKLHQTDMAALGAGIFDIEISVWDASEGEILQIEQGCLHVAPAMSGQADGEESSSSASSTSSGGSSESSG